MVNKRLRLTTDVRGRERGLLGIERIFATNAALTPRLQRSSEFQEVVLAQPIHGLLRTGRQFLPQGVKSSLLSRAFIADRRSGWERSPSSRKAGFGGDKACREHREY